MLGTRNPTFGGTLGQRQKNARFLLYSGMSDIPPSVIFVTVSVMQKKVEKALR